MWLTDRSDPFTNSCSQRGHGNMPSEFRLDRNCTLPPSNLHIWVFEMHRGCVSVVPVRGLLHLMHNRVLNQIWTCPKKSGWFAYLPLRFAFLFLKFHVGKSNSYGKFTHKDVAEKQSSILDLVAPNRMQRSASVCWWAYVSLQGIIRSTTCCCT